MNLFDAFGIDRIEEPEKETKKNIAKPATKKAGASKKKKITYKLPVTVHYGFGEPMVIKESKNGGSEIEEKEIKTAFSEYSGWPENFFSLIGSENVLYANAQGALMNKGNLHLNSESKVWLAGKLFDLSSIMTEEECEVSVEEIKKLAFAEMPIFNSAEDIDLHFAKNFMIVTPSENIKDTEKIEFPVRIMLLGRGNMEIKQETYYEYLAAKKKGDVKHDDTMELAAVKDYILEKYPEYKNRLKVGYNRKAKVLLVTMSFYPKTSASQKKEKTYPTNATVSLVFTKISLTPEMFDGKEQATEKEIISILAKDFPEYSKDRTTLTYDDKLNLIIPVLKSATKGAGLLEQVETIEREKEIVGDGSRYYCYVKKENGREYRIENIPDFAKFRVSLDGEMAENKCKLFLPKIPGTLFEEAYIFFKLVSRLYNTEAALQIFYSKSNRNYFIYCPKQIASYASVDILRNEYIECDPDNILVMDLHSHGTIKCSFSDTDNKDEKGTRFYTVFYGLDEDGHFSVDVRGGCAGRYIQMSAEYIFDMDEMGLTGDIDFNLWLGQVEVV